MSFVQTFEIRHLRRVTRLHEGFETRLHQRGRTAAQHGLFAEEVRFGLFAEVRFDDPRTPTAIGAGIGQSNVFGLARCVLRHGNEARHPATGNVRGADRVSRTFRRNHDHVQIRARFDELEMHVEAMRKSQRRAFFHVPFEVIAVQRRRQFVRHQNHDHVGIFHRVGHLGHGKLRVFGLAPRAGAGAQTHRDVHARIAQVVCVRVAL